MPALQFIPLCRASAPACRPSKNPGRGRQECLPYNLDFRLFARRASCSDSPILPKQRSTICLGLCLLLAAATFAVYGQTAHHEFVSFDDDLYITSNPHVLGGLTWANIRWAFTTGHATNWHPLTWLSHMLDCQLFGANPGAHHLISVALHTANAVLLFLLLVRTTNGPSTPRDESVSPRRPDRTGDLWRSAFVAALFALHPLHVESVAWASERKDVLSTFFWLLTSLAYVQYAQRPTFFRHARALLLFALGLMAKPMLVTLPFVLLLMDYWPLRRFQNKTTRALLLEKIPFVFLSIASSVITFIVQRAQAVIPFEVLPLPVRVGNAFIAYVTYLWKMIWPADLACFYQHPLHLDLFSSVLCAAVLLAISVVVIFQAKNRPYLFVGWFWYLVTLLPVIGVVQVGSQSHADRYTYIPLIGIFILIAWAAHDLLNSLAPRLPRWPAAFAGALVLIAYATAAHAQVSYWHDSITLFQQTLKVAEKRRAGGETFPAAMAEISLGKAFVAKGERSQAVSHFQAALQIAPNYYKIHEELGSVLLAAGQKDEARAEFERALQLKPASAFAHAGLGAIYTARGQIEAAIDKYRQALQLQPRFPVALNNLAWIYATDEKFHDGADALRLAELANRQNDDSDAASLDTLAAAYAEAGRFSEAVQTAERALQLATAEGNAALADAIRTHVKFYRAHSPYRDAAK